LIQIADSIDGDDWAIEQLRAWGNRNSIASAISIQFPHFQFIRSANMGIARLKLIPFIPRMTGEYQLTRVFAGAPLSCERLVH
jgi:hypothetical protein